MKKKAKTLKGKAKPKSKPAKSQSKTAANKSGLPRNKAGIVPLNDRVLVQPLSQEEMGRTTSFGIIIPETVDKKKPDQGTVVAVGPGKRNDRGERMPLEVKPGDRVYFSKPWDEPQKIDGVDYYFIAETDILAVIKK
jgi:chaperonin GroES